MRKEIFMEPAFSIKCQPCFRHFICRRIDFQQNRFAVCRDEIRQQPASISFSPDIPADCAMPDINIYDTFPESDEPDEKAVINTRHQMVIYRP